MPGAAAAICAAPRQKPFFVFVPRESCYLPGIALIIQKRIASSLRAIVAVIIKVDLVYNTTSRCDRSTGALP